MKKVIYIASLCFASLFVSSCDDYLTLESPDQLTSGSFWRNESDAQAGISAAYSQLEYYIDTWEFAEVKWPVEAYREDIINMGNDARNYPNWLELYNFTYTNGNSQFSNYWWNNYKGASFANQVIEKVTEMEEGTIDPTVRTQIINEGYFLRAYYHLKLLLNWKEIIIRDKYITSQAELSKGLSPRPDAWDFIIEDLKRATALPSSYDNDNIGRATSGAANAYLGFAYLTRAYEESDKKTLNIDINTGRPFSIYVDTAHPVDIQHSTSYQLGIVFSHHFLIKIRSHPMSLHKNIPYTSPKSSHDHRRLGHRLGN